MKTRKFKRLNPQEFEQIKIMLKTGIRPEVLEKVLSRSYTVIHGVADAKTFAEYEQVHHPRMLAIAERVSKANNSPEVANMVSLEAQISRLEKRLDKLEKFKTA